jgi:hypothetical protein
MHALEGAAQDHARSCDSKHARYSLTTWTPRSSLCYTYLPRPLEQSLRVLLLNTRFSACRRRGALRNCAPCICGCHMTLGLPHDLMCTGSLWLQRSVDRHTDRF